ncbi:MAG: RIP metalloprotease RseP, partial [Thiohalophilus sp.]
MLEFAYYALAFIVAISVLIAVHEFGHFWVAKKLGVKVLRYSIGFGRPIWRTVRGKDRTEYVVAALPLGGYVQMLDEKDGEVKDEEKHRAFNRQPIWKRFSIVAAGPIFNFLFAVVALWLMFVIGSNALVPVIGKVSENTPAAQAGLKPDQKIISIDGEATPVWEVAMNHLLPALVDRKIIQVTTQNPDGSTSQHHLNLQGVDRELDPDNLFELLGFSPWRPSVEPVIGQVLQDSPAGRAGLKKGDRIVKMDNQEISTFGDMVEYVTPRPEVPITLRYKRNGEFQEVTVTPQKAER